jgi:hypothetical protein
MADQASIVGLLLHRKRTRWSAAVAMYQMCQIAYKDAASLSSTLPLLGSVTKGLREAFKQWAWNFHHVSRFPGH